MNYSPNCVFMEEAKLNCMHVYKCIFILYCNISGVYNLKGIFSQYWVTAALKVSFFLLLQHRFCTRADKEAPCITMPSRIHLAPQPSETPAQVWIRLLCRIQSLQRFPKSVKQTQEPIFRVNNLRVWQAMLQEPKAIFMQLPCWNPTVLLF